MKAGSFFKPETGQGTGVKQPVFFNVGVAVPISLWHRCLFRESEKTNGPAGIESLFFFNKEANSEQYVQTILLKSPYFVWLYP